MLTEAVPAVSRVALFWFPANPTGEEHLKAVDNAARSLGVQPYPQELRGPQDFESAFSAITAGQAGALQILGDPLVFINSTRLAELVTRNRLPAIGPFREFAEAGGLMYRGIQFPAMFRRAAYYIDRILKGAKPADLPVELPTTFDFVVNLKTAQALGLTIPQSVLMQATEIIR